jgi:eukaryotic-like serine/threonine-protein kinase
VQTAATDTLVGRSLEGRYRILERIARGGMSTVYAAVDERLDRLVAVKVMSSALSADPAFSDRFAREARAAARLTHLNVVSVYDQGSELAADGHHVFLVMELVEGRTLRELLRERGRLSPAEAISIMEPVLSALAAAHRAGLVHRDVKPENILLSDDGIVKVADFGLARAVEADVAATRTGLMMGTVAYCAPEQFSQGRVDQRSDVYAAGVMLFELLTGRPPYKGESAMNVAYQHVHSRVPAPSSRVKGIANEIDELVVAATDRDPSGRPADAGAFLAEVADVRAQLRLPVVPVPPRSRVRGRTSRHEPQYRTPDSETTDQLGRRASTNDTTVVPRRSEPHVGQRLPLLTGDERVPPPPPPVVIPPKKRRELSAKQRRRRRFVLGLILMLLLGTAAGVGGWWFASGRYSHVPQVAHLSQTEAFQKLRAAHLDPHLGGTVFDDTVPRGDVVRTVPGAGARVKRGDLIEVYVSAGAKFVQMPDFTGEDPQQAASSLRGYGFTGGSTLKYESSETIPANRVTRTDPPANHKAQADKQVVIWVSTGKPRLPIPDIPANTPYDEAKKTLEHAGFKVKRNDEFSDTIDKDAVISISPSRGKAREDSTITVTVSKGPEIVNVPDIAPGTLLSDAEAALQSVGLNWTVNHPYGERPDAVVLNVDPRPGTPVHVGDTVTLTVF